MIPRLFSEGTSSLARHRYVQLFLEVWPIVSQDRDRDGIGGGVTTANADPRGCRCYLTRCRERARRASRTQADVDVVALASAEAGRLPVQLPRLRGRIVLVSAVAGRGHRDDVRSVGPPALIRTVDHDRWRWRPGSCGKSNGAFFRLVKCTTSRPPRQAATGGTRHGQEYQGSCASAGP